MNKIIKKYIALFLSLTVCLFSLSGCTYSVYSIDRLAYAVAIGIDIGTNNKIKVSFQLSIPGGESGSSGSSQSDSSIVNSVECASIDAGINLLNSYISKEVNLSHCKVIVFSEEFAYLGLSESIYTLMNNIQIRPDCSIIISRCDAEYFLKNSQPVLEKLSARYYEIAPSSSDYTGYTEDVTLSEFFSDFKDTFTQCHAILGGVNTASTQSTDTKKSSNEKDSDIKSGDTLISSEANLENMGLAVFHGDRLVGELSGIETICHQIIVNELSIANISVPSPFEEDKNITLQIRLSDKTKSDVELTDNGPSISVKMNLEARVLTMNETSDYLSSENVKLLEKYFTSYMTDKVYDYLYKISKEFNSDIDSFGKYAVKYFSNWDDWVNYNWLQRFDTSFFTVDITTNVKSGYVLIES